MFHFKQLISEFTRIEKESSTISDLILVSEYDTICQSGVINTTLSDQFMIYCTRKVSKHYIGTHNNVTIRSMKNYNKDDFQKSLLNIGLNYVML